MSFGHAKSSASISSTVNEQFLSEKQPSFIANMIPSTIPNTKEATVSLSKAPEAKSLLEMEPNPFEMSFKERESSVAAAAAAAAVAITQNKNSLTNQNGISNSTLSKPNSSTASSVNATNSTSGPTNVISPTLFSGPQFLTPGGRRILPPMSAISSPSALLSNGAISPVWNGSLRSGPLSPAMLQGPQHPHPLPQTQTQSQQQAQSQRPNNSQQIKSTSNPSSSATSSLSLLSLANATSVATPASSATINSSFPSTSSNSRPGPLSPFPNSLSSSLLQSDAPLFSTPGPATAEILSSLGGDIINGSTGVTPLGFKVSTGSTPGGTSSMISALLPSTSQPMPNSMNKPAVTGPAIAPLNSSTTTTENIFPNPTTTNIDTSGGSSVTPLPGTQIQSSYNGSVDAANSLYLMSKSGVIPSQLPQNKPNSHQHSQTTHAIHNGFIPVNSSSREQVAKPFTTAPSSNVLTSPLSSQQEVPNALQTTDPLSQNIQGVGPNNTKMDTTDLDIGISSSALNSQNSKKHNLKTNRSKRKRSDSFETSLNDQSKNIKRECLDNNSMQEVKSDSQESKMSEDNAPTSQSTSSSSNTNKNEKKQMSAEEKRKSFLERNRIAALKCRQRKKQWMEELQEKVETYTTENNSLKKQLNSALEEIKNLKTLLLQHKNCSLSLSPEVLSKLLTSTTSPIENGSNCNAVNNSKASSEAMADPQNPVSGYSQPNTNRMSQHSQALHSTETPIGINLSGIIPAQGLTSGIQHPHPSQQSYRF